MNAESRACRAPTRPPAAGPAMWPAREPRAPARLERRRSAIASTCPHAARPGRRRPTSAAPADCGTCGASSNLAAQARASAARQARGRIAWRVLATASCATIRQARWTARGDGSAACAKDLRLARRRVSKSTSARAARRTPSRKRAGRRNGSRTIASTSWPQIRTLERSVMAASLPRWFAREVPGTVRAVPSRRTAHRVGVARKLTNGPRAEHRERRTDRRRHTCDARLPGAGDDHRLARRPRGADQAPRHHRALAGQVTHGA